jgi:transposase
VIPPGVRIFLCTEPVDMRHGFDRMAQTARERVGQDPQQGGALFAFSNRRATRLKVLWFERNGMCVLYKRLHRAVFELPAAATGTRSILINGEALSKLLAGTARVTRSAQKTSARVA